MKFKLLALQSLLPSERLQVQVLALGRLGRSSRAVACRACYQYSRQIFPKCFPAAWWAKASAMRSSG